MCWPLNFVWHLSKLKLKGKLEWPKYWFLACANADPDYCSSEVKPHSIKKITCGIAPTTVTVLVTLIEKKSSRSLSTKMFWLTKNQERGPIRNCSRPQSALKREQDNRGRGNAEI